MKEKKPLAALKDGTTYFEYMRAIRDSRLKALPKALLYFYAGAYNWEEQRPSYYEEVRVAAHTGMSVSSLQKFRKELVNLGWINVYGGGYRRTPFVDISLGKDDPKFELMGYSTWEPENKSLSSFELSKLSKTEVEEYFEKRSGHRKKKYKVRKPISHYENLVEKIA
jgi:hypothetical protein